jgi:hypothetical protein
MIILLGLLYKTKEPFNDTNFMAITYDNSSTQTNTDNLKNLFELKGFNYEIVGKNEAWNGWYGRLNAYLKKINTIDNKDYFILLCDGRDVLINENFDDFFTKATSIYYKNNNSIIFGAERHCCEGNAGINNDYYKNAMIQIGKPKTNYDYYYLNFGLIFGKITDIKVLFEKLNIQPNDTDQSLMVMEYCKNPNKYHLDYNQELFTNNSGECKLIWDDNVKKYKNETTKTFPSFLHFPGKNWDCYKNCANKIFEKYNKTPHFITE